MAAPVPLEAQIEEVAKTVRDRQRSWLDEGRRGRMLEETAARKTEHLRAAEATLRWLARNMGWIKGEAEARRLRDRHDAEIAADEARRRARVIDDPEDHPSSGVADDDTPDDAPDDRPEAGAMHGGAGDPSALDTDPAAIAAAERAPEAQIMRRHFPDAEVLGVRSIGP